MKKTLDKIKLFLNEVRAELGKVNWPDRKSIIGSTGVVLVTTVIMLVFLWAMDLILSNILQLVYKF